MSTVDFPRLRKELENHILAKTGNRLQNLDVELSSNGVCLHGQTKTFYVKQLAQQSIREMLPDVQVQNDIRVS
jgi:osmotically-inducible protein OsmY